MHEFLYVYIGDHGRDVGRALDHGHEQSRRVSKPRKCQRDDNNPYGGEGRA